MNQYWVEKVATKQLDPISFYLISKRLPNIIPLAFLLQIKLKLCKYLKKKNEKDEKNGKFAKAIIDTKKVIIII